jgi:hypothetical protein
VTESITVSTSAQIIEATSATLSGVVENKRIIDLPLNGRNVFTLAALTPGVFGWQPASGSGGVGEGFESIGRFTVNGGRDSSNAIMMDGVPVTVNSNTAEHEREHGSAHDRRCGRVPHSDQLLLRGVRA